LLPLEAVDFRRSGESRETEKGASQARFTLILGADGPDVKLACCARRREKLG
jgi:hypothetical protein